MGALGAAALGTPARAVLAEVVASRAKIAKVGIQLYTLRTAAAADLAGTLSRLSKIGYKEIEFAGYYNHPASDIRAILDQNGLTAPSAHIAIDLIQNSPDKTFADAKTVGHEWITVPSLPRGAKATADDWKRVADQFNSAAKTCKAAGFKFAFHNHNDIVKSANGILPIEILMKETDPSLVSYEMDIYWAVNGGADPLQLLATYPGRFKMFHAKDSMGPPDQKMADVGAGVIDFKTIFAAARGIEHYFVEHDQPADAFASAKASYTYLANLTF
jgi:sugar phosphate isomerase/epimerase